MHQQSDLDTLKQVRPRYSRCHSKDQVPVPTLWYRPTVQGHPESSHPNVILVRWRARQHKTYTQQTRLRELGMRVARGFEYAFRLDREHWSSPALKLERKQFHGTLGPPARLRGALPRSLRLEHCCSRDQKKRLPDQAAQQPNIRSRQWYSTDLINVFCPDVDNRVEKWQPPNTLQELLR